MAGETFADAAASYLVMVTRQMGPRSAIKATVEQRIADLMG
jgi:hypothetical protein